MTRVSMSIGRILILCVGWMALAFAPSAAQQTTNDTIAQVKPSIVGIGTFDDLRRPPALLTGTGFVVGDGLHVITNDHVVSKVAQDDSLGRIIVFTPRAPGRALAGEVSYRFARIVAADRDHDLAILKMEGGAPLPPLEFDSRRRVREGDAVAFTGFPIGSVLGLYPATHQGAVSAISPAARPVVNPGELTPGALKRLRENFNIYQLDAVAYPGNSGSPVYDPGTGRVLAIINSVYVKESRETALTEPSGITYAIPIEFAVELLRKAQSASN